MLNANIKQTRVEPTELEAIASDISSTRALILFKTLAPYKSFTYLLTYLLPLCEHYAQLPILSLSQLSILVVYYALHSFLIKL